MHPGSPSPPTEGTRLGLMPAGRSPRAARQVQPRWLYIHTSNAVRGFQDAEPKARPYRHRLLPALQCRSPRRTARVAGSCSQTPQNERQRSKGPGAAGAGPCRGWCDSQALRSEPGGGTRPQRRHASLGKDTENTGCPGHLRSQLAGRCVHPRSWGASSERR